jgi:ZIP family zinc transporter
MTPLVLAIATFVSTLLGGLVALHRRHQLHLVTAFAAGVLIAAALLDLLPDAFHQVEQTGESSIENVLLGAALGFLAFYALDRFVHSSAAMHTPRPGKAAFGTFAALGLTIHSFLDGFAIGSGFRVDATIGLLVATAVIAHDFGDGISTVGIVLGSRGGIRESLGWLVADAVAPVLGAGIALMIAISSGMLANLLGFFAGSFLFIGGAHLLPESSHEGKGMQVPATFLSGFVFIFVVTQLLAH